MNDWWYNNTKHNNPIHSILSITTPRSRCFSICSAPTTTSSCLSDHDIPNIILISSIKSLNKSSAEPTDQADNQVVHINVDWQSRVEKSTEWTNLRDSKMIMTGNWHAQSHNLKGRSQEEVCCTMMAINCNINRSQIQSCFQLWHYCSSQSIVKVTKT